MSEPMKLLVKDIGGERHTALFINERLYEYYIEEAGAQSLVGAVLLGKVERVLPDVSAAFVKLGQEHNGFLPLKESESFMKRQGASPLITGRDVIVQVKKDAHGDKGAFLTRDAALIGQYIILLPMSGFVGVSKRVTDEDERKAAISLGKRLSKGKFGVVVRHAALHADESEIEAELVSLAEKWTSIVKAAEYAKPPALLYKDADMSAVLMRDYSARHTIEVYAAEPRPDDISDNAVWHEVSAVELDALWQGKRVQPELNAALAGKVPLKGGGSLVIDEREALQTIDVNSGENVQAAEGMSLALAQNLAAVDEIARQMRLRALSGVIIIDFIDMQSDDERELVLNAMREAVSDDRVKTVVHGFTSLGLMEMTRKRTRESLLETMSEPCSRCKGSGRTSKTNEKGKRT